MMNYVLMTDSDSDLPLHFQQELNIPVVHMPYTLDGKEYFDDLGQTMSSKDFFDKMRAGASASTSALNEMDYLEYFEPILKENDLLFIAFSSAMSSTINGVYSAREQLLEKYPERTFKVVDTLSICAPMTLLVLKAHEMARNGASMEEVEKWVLDNRMRANAYFTVDDLNYLKRGGRITGTAAALGSLLNLKPILFENREGMIAAYAKVRGRRSALNYIVDKTVENLEDPTESPIIVCHADALEDAEKVKTQLETKIPGANVLIENIGPVIGAHAGPGTVAVCFLGKERPAQQ